MAHRPTSTIAMAGSLALCAAYGLAWAADGSAVAHIGKQPIDAQELSTRAAARISEQQRAYEKSLLQLRLKQAREEQSIKEEELAKLIDERVLALEAAARKSTPEALLEKLPLAPIGDAEIRKFFDANQAQIRQPFEAVQSRIRDYLLKQEQSSARSAFLATLRLKYHAVDELEPLREVVAATGPQRGPATAPVTIIEFSDFQCPYCGRFAPVIKQIMDKHPNDVRLIFRHLPLAGLHPNAQKAAEAGVCAQAQGKFWELHDLMFAEQSSLAVDALKEKAKRIGLDTAAFDECLTSGKSAAIVSADVQAAEQLGIAGTPASFVNGRFLDGAVPAEDLEALVQDELRRSAHP